MDDDSIIYAYPLHPLDCLSGTRNIFVSWVMRFNDVLDADKLHQSLSRLLELGDWRKLGGRIRRGKDGKLKIHAPAQFGSLLPAIAFGHDNLSDSSIEQHRVASLLPKPSGDPFIGESNFNDVFRPLSGLAMMPQTLDDIIRLEAPPLALHVSSFSDATVVALSYPHVLTDAFGLRSLLSSWSLVLAGRETEVPPLRGASTDLLREALRRSEAGEAPGGVRPETHVLESIRLGKLAKGKVLLRLAADRMKKPEPQQRIIFIPEALVTRLQQATSSINKGDALVAWLVRGIATAAVSPKPPPPVTLISAANARFHLPSIMKPDEALAQNTVFMTHTPLTREQTAGSLESIARAFRSQNEAQTTEPQVLGLLRSTYRALDAGQEPLDVYGETKAMPMLVNDLTDVDVYNTVDFAPAVIKRGDTTTWADNPPGSVVYCQLQSKLVNDQKMANVFTIWGRDRQGNYWINATLAPKTWNGVREALKGIMSVETEEGKEVLQIPDSVIASQDPPALPPR
ncbi:hypothetical protein CP533_4960 [Ophiocordyceps camponoti-saundersi (nom. inval.)]|nr:hypothetical protein CP533_4960 [Ophiocordyceps camponoti-saundersi (nom. inval.)]